jgi:Flp pilus assembly protein TadD
MGRYAEAVQPLNQAISLRPDYAEAYNELGYAYRKLKRSQEAISAYRRAISLKTDYSSAYFGLGDVYFYDTNQYREAIQAYKQCARD